MSRVGYTPNFRVNKYAVIGNPITHSKSPQIHSAFAQQENVQIDYQRILADEANFIASVDSFIQAGGLGLNVTVPFKIQAYENCAHLDEFAQAAKAVNTISFDQQKGWLGANTDGIGLLRDLKDNLGLTLENKKILVLGAGGATRGILLPLLKENPTRLVIANRTIIKASTLADEFSSLGEIASCGYKELGNEAFDIVINATSASLHNTLPAIPDMIVCSKSICYDLVYSDSATSFLLWAKRQGVQQISDGIGMLIEQAAESYNIWRGFRPQTKEIFKLLRP